MYFRVFHKHADTHMWRLIIYSKIYKKKNTQFDSVYIGPRFINQLSLTKKFYAIKVFKFSIEGKKSSALSTTRFNGYDNLLCLNIFRNYEFTKKRAAF